MSTTAALIHKSKYLVGHLARTYVRAYVCMCVNKFCGCAAVLVVVVVFCLDCVGGAEGPTYDLPTVMSRFLHLGMSLNEVDKSPPLLPFGN